MTEINTGTFASPNVCANREAAQRLAQTAGKPLMVVFPDEDMETVVGKMFPGGVFENSDRD